MNNEEEFGLVPYGKGKEVGPPSPDWGTPIEGEHREVPEEPIPEWFPPREKVVTEEERPSMVGFDLGKPPISEEDTKRLQLLVEQKARRLGKWSWFKEELFMMENLSLEERDARLREILRDLEEIEEQQGALERAKVGEIEARTEREKQLAKAAKVGGTAAGIYAGFYAAEKVGKGTVAAARGMRDMLVPKTERKERLAEFYTGKQGLGLYSAPGLRMYPGRPQPSQPAVVHKPWASPFGQLMTQPGTKPRGFASPLAQMVWPIRGTRPTPTTETLPRPTLGEQTPTRDLQSYMEKKGYEPVSSLRGIPAYFWIGTKQGSEPSSNAWVVRLQTGRYGLAGIGDKTGRPRSKISWATPEDALDAASDIPGR